MPKEPRTTARQIVGLSLPPDVARDFKTEATRRGLSVRALFQEMWAAYKANTTRGKK